jgi:LEA14-like dessication related protein
MSILGSIQEMKNLMIRFSTFTLLVGLVFLQSCKRPSEDVVLRNIKDVVIDAHTDPMLRANAIFYNPSDMRGRLRRINVDIYVDGKKAATVNQKLKTVIPARGEFTVPLEVKLAIKELGVMNTLLGVVGGKKFEVRYEGSLGLSYHGLPIKVPVKHKDYVRIRF